MTSNWIDNGFQGGYLVGSNTFADVLLIQDGGVLSNKVGYLGYGASSSNNTVLVSGSGSTWSNGNSLVVGLSGSGNSLVISNGGNVFSSDGNYKGSHIGHSAGSNSVLITGNGSLWRSPGQIIVGDISAGNSLVISNGGQVADNFGFVGFNGGSNNNVVVTGAGSAWNNSTNLSIGNSGGGNSLVISDGGQVLDASGYMGVDSFRGGNAVLVTGADSIWTNRGDLFVGFDRGNSGKANSLVISNGGQVFDNSGYIGYSFVSTNNTVRVMDGAVWRNNALRVGFQGKDNALLVNGGSVLATNVVVGFASTTCDNLIQLDSGSVIVTNGTADAVFEVRQGKYVQNGGLLQVDRFIMTNSCAQFVRTGGTLIYGTAMLDPTRDDDGDGLSNGYEQSHGLDPLKADADVDSDGDETLPQVQRQQAEEDEEYLAGVEQHQPFERRVHEAVAVQADAEHVHAEPRERSSRCCRRWRGSSGRVRARVRPSARAG